MCEGQKHTQKARYSVFQSIQLNANKAAIITAVLLVACEKTCERNNGASRDTASLAGRFPLYPLEMIHLRKILFNELTFLLKKQIFYLVLPCFGGN